MVRRILGIVLVAFILLATPVSAEATASDIAQKLVCQCGCTQTLANCSEPVCSIREEMKADIARLVGEGKSEPQVIQYFVTRYGEQVLAAPEKSGFNLVVWIVPFAVIIIGAAVIALAMKRWVGRGRVYQAAAGAADESGDDKKYAQRLEKDLKNFTDGGYR